MLAPTDTKTKALILILLLAMPSFAGDANSRQREDRRCKSNPKLIGACFRIHGRAYFSNGTPDFRIWRVGTKRVLGVTATSTADDAEDPIVPAKLLRAFHATASNPFGNDVFGDFEVCHSLPSAKARCVQSAEHLVVQHLNTRK